jgi:hypothetical protein
MWCNSLLDTTGELGGAEYGRWSFEFKSRIRYEQSPYKNGITVGDFNWIFNGWGIVLVLQSRFSYSNAKKISQQGFLTKDLDSISSNNNVINASIWCNFYKTSLESVSQSWNSFFLTDGSENPPIFRRL